MKKNAQPAKILYLSLRGIYDEAIQFTKLFSGLPRSLSFARNDGIKLSTINQKHSHMSPRFHLSSIGGNGVLAVQKQSGRYKNGLTIATY